MKNIELREIAAVERFMELSGPGRATMVTVEVPLATTLFAVGIVDGNPYLERVVVEKTLDVEVIGGTRLVGDHPVLDGGDGSIFNASVVEDASGTYWWRAQSVVEQRPISTVATIILTNLDKLVQDQRWKPIAESHHYHSTPLAEYLPNLAYGLSQCLGFDGVESVYYRSTAPVHRIYPTLKTNGERIHGLHGKGETPRAQIVLEDPFLGVVRNAQTVQAPAWAQKLMSFNANEHVQLATVAKLLTEKGNYLVGPLPSRLTGSQQFRPYDTLRDVKFFLLRDMKDADLLRSFKVNEAAERLQTARNDDPQACLDAVNDLRNVVDQVVRVPFSEFCRTSRWPFHVSPLDVMKERFEAILATQAAFVN
jgi:hypothetical protein